MKKTKVIRKSGQGSKAHLVDFVSTWGSQPSTFLSSSGTPDFVLHWGLDCTTTSGREVR